jgi:hypothetical protein
MTSFERRQQPSGIAASARTDVTSSEWRIALEPSSLPQTLEASARLLSLGETNGDAPVIWATASLVAAVALDQHTRSVLRSMAKRESLRGHVHPDGTDAGVVNQADSLWSRTVKLPQLLTNGARRFDANHPVAAALRDLISLRNRLMHIDEALPTLVVEGETLADGAIRLKVPLERLKLRPTPWNQVSRQDAHRFYDAVAEYTRLTGDVARLTEPLFPLNTSDSSSDDAPAT